MIFLHKSETLLGSPIYVSKSVQGRHRNVDVHLEKVVGTPLGSNCLTVDNNPEPFVSLGVSYHPEGGGSLKEQCDWLSIFMSLEGAKAARDQLDDSIAKAEHIKAQQEVIV